MRQSNHWKDTAPAIPSFADRPLPERTDVVVIGGGYTGISTALHLAKRGARVTVLERESMGWGASCRNGGMALSGLKVSVPAAVRRYGAEVARRLYLASLASIDFVEELVRSEGIDCDFARCGALELACRPAHFEGLRQTRALLEREFGHRTELIGRAEQRREIGSDYYHGGLLDPQSAGLHPGKYMAGLAAAAARAGVELHDGVEARGLRRTPSGWEVATARGIVRAGEVMVATNGYTGAVHPPLRRRVIPIGSYIIVTEPLPPALAEDVSPRGRMMYDTRHFLYYFRLTPDKRMMFGGRASFVPSTPETDRESARILQRGMAQVYPQLAGVPVAQVWGGTLGFTRDLMPRAGEMDGVHYALGYGGHGVAMASYLGKCMAQVMDGHPEANPFRGMDFPAVPLYNGWAWFLPLARVAHKALDWLT